MYTKKLQIGVHNIKFILLYRVSQNNINKRKQSFWWNLKQSLVPLCSIPHRFQDIQCRINSENEGYQIVFFFHFRTVFEVNNNPSELNHHNVNWKSLKSWKGYVIYKVVKDFSIQNSKRNALLLGYFGDDLYFDWFFHL